jgi:acyl CoA:acetate/3-ketoacid CoA transferase beta subunit
MVATDYGLFEITPEGIVLKEFAPGFTPEEIQEVTEAGLIISPGLRKFQT